jgi:hypothetical protein
MSFLREKRTLALVCLTIVSATTTIRAQQRILWQGAVKPNRINVYSGPSTNEPVSILRLGQVVNVVLEVNVDTTAWCRVGFPGAEPIGYVLCMNLEQGKFTSQGNTRSESDTTQARSSTTGTAPGGATETPSNPTALTNKDILDMNKTGLPPEILLAKIKSSQCNFDTSPARLQQLKSGGVPDAVILAMVQAPLGQAEAHSASPDPPATISSVASAAPDVSPSDGKVRVLVTDSQSWETRGGSSAGGNRNGWGASSWIAGGARPQTVEIIKTLNQRCPEIIVTNNLAKADFVLTLDHEGGKGLLSHRNKIAVFNRDGDDIFSNSTRELGNSVKDACQAILNAKR